MAITPDLIAPFIDGRSTASQSDEPFEMISPTSGRLLGSYGVGSSADVDRAVAAARSAFDDGRWHLAAPSFRQRVLTRLADLIETHAPDIDRLDAIEMGKPVSLRFCNAVAGAQFTRFCAEALDKMRGDVLTSDAPTLITQRRVPFGVVGAIASWNFPTFVALLKAIPALAAGNTVVLKPSEYSPSSALWLAKLAHEAGLPDGVLNIVPGTGAIVGSAIALHHDVDMLSFTGSTQVGKLMLHHAGDSNMKNLLLECGGKSPQIVFDDGLDLDQVADAICASLLTNQGQVCSIGTRVIAASSIAEPLTERIATRFATVAMGDPTEPTTTFGPIASRRQLAGIEAHIARACEEGAELVTGGRRALPETGGNFIEPTLFKRVAPNAALARDEIFGPVLPILTFNDEKQAIAIANGTEFGLSGTLWTTRLAAGMRVAKALNSSVSVKTGVFASEGARYMSSSEPAGQSGIGVEGGMAGIESYMRRQTISFFHG